MASINHKKEPDLKTEIGLRGGVEYLKRDSSAVREHIKKESEKRSPDQQLATRLQAIQYKIEEYIENNEIGTDELYSIESFLNTYLKVLNIPFKKFALTIDTTDANLKKYLSGQRKFNTDLAMKFGSFFHTSPDLWIRIYTKNELLLLKREKSHLAKYKKYDYRKLVHFENTGSVHRK